MFDWNMHRSEESNMQGLLVLFPFDAALNYSTKRKRGLHNRVPNKRASLCFVAETHKSEWTALAV